MILNNDMTAIFSRSDLLRILCLCVIEFVKQFFAVYSGNITVFFAQVASVHIIVQAPQINVNDKEIIIAGSFNHLICEPFVMLFLYPDKGCPFA